MKIKKAIIYQLLLVLAAAGWVIFTATTQPKDTAITIFIRALLLLAIGYLLSCAHKKLKDARRFRTQQNIINRRYLEQRLYELVKSTAPNRAYRAVSPSSDEQMRIITERHKGIGLTYRVEFTNEEYVCAGESNGNIRERNQNTYLIAPKHAQILHIVSSKQVYADQTVHTATPIVVHRHNHLTDEVFAKIEGALFWQRTDN